MVEVLQSTFKRTKFAVVFRAVFTAVLLALSGWAVASTLSTDNPAAEPLVIAQPLVTTDPAPALEPTDCAASTAEEKRREDTISYGLTRSRQTFSFHYLDILEWLFQRGHDKPHQQQNAFH